jgi:LacI family transcriptional regulator
LSKRRVSRKTSGPTDGDRTISRRATIYEIATAAGVSPKTVSRVLNDEPFVKDAVRARVKAVAKDLHYQPNIAAKGLITRRSFLIGLTYERPSPSYVVELQRGVLERLADERYRMIILPFRDVCARRDEFVEFLKSAALDGVVLAPPGSEDGFVLDQLDAANIRYGRIAPQSQADRGACSLIDDAAAACEVADHLLALGHRRLAVIRGDATHGSSTARSAGYARAFAAAGIALDQICAEQGDYTFASGEAAMQRILARTGPRPTAILAQNDDMAVGAMMVARQAGLSIPEDLSVVGFDDSDIARLVMPGLTTVRQPVFDMAMTATCGLLKLLAGEAVPAPVPHAHELLVRQSTAAPRG